MKRSEFLKSLGLGTSGLVLPSNSFIQHQASKIYDNYIRGLTHYCYPKLRKNIKEGDELTLRREADNLHDLYAIEVFYEENKLGYISAYENIVLANMLDNGVELKTFASKVNLKEVIYKGLAIEVFAQLVLPSKKLIQLVNQ